MFMARHDESTSPDRVGSGSGPSGGAATGPRAGVAAGDRPGRLWALAMGAGLLAGVASWGVGEATVTAFKPELRRIEVMGAVTMQATRSDELRAEWKNAALAFGVLGGLLGVALGGAGGIAGGSARRGLVGGVAGLVVGGALGASASLALVPVFNRARAADPISPDLTIPMIVHGGIWGAAGAAGGLAFGLGLGLRGGRLARAAVGGLVGGAVAAVAFNLIGAIALPLADTSRPLSTTGGTRLLARVLAATLAAAGAVLLIVEGRPRKAAAVPPPS